VSLFVERKVDFRVTLMSYTQKFTSSLVFLPLPSCKSFSAKVEKNRRGADETDGNTTDRRNAAAAALRSQEESSGHGAAGGSAGGDLSPASPAGIFARRGQTLPLFYSLLSGVSFPLPFLFLYALSRIWCEENKRKNALFTPTTTST
jgi:hypothetical protein